MGNATLRRIIAVAAVIASLAGCSADLAADSTDTTWAETTRAEQTANTLPPVSQPSATQPMPERPSATITCPATAYLGRVEFGGRWQVHTRTARLSISYGDGKSYQTRRLEHFDSAYWHDYAMPGTFHVAIALTDGAGQSASDSCSVSVRAKVPTYVPPPIAQPPSYPRLPGGIDHDWPTNPGPGSSDPDRPIQPYPAPPGDPNDRDGDGVACEYGCKN
jgi:hypothetical protein